MPELPEIYCRANEMKRELVGRTITAVEVIQPKSLNLPVEEFQAALTGARILNVSYRGKWIQVGTERGWLLLNLGMGGEILLTSRQRLPEKYRLIIDFQDGACLSINFWWFGYAHYAPLRTEPKGLGEPLGSGEIDHPMVARLGPNAIDLSPQDLQDLLKGQRGAVKAFLLDQSKIAGIGNAYIHDILFMARLHPKRKIDSLREAEIEALWKAIGQGLRPSIEQGGAFYETTLHGEKGGFQFESILVGYREGQPCPKCGTPIQKIKTGGTSSFICPSCQVLG
jgi:formamidopyrimidine-DNA glycosylase